MTEGRIEIVFFEIAYFCALIKDLLFFNFLFSLSAFPIPCQYGFPESTVQKWNQVTSLVEILKRGRNILNKMKNKGKPMRPYMVIYIKCQNV